MIYLLNTPILTAYGDYRFTGPLLPEQAASRLTDGFISAVGHQAAAAFLGRLLGVHVPARRVSVTMNPGDSALVLRLTTRLPEGKTLTEQEMGQVDYQLGWLERTA